MRLDLRRAVEEVHVVVQLDGLLRPGVLEHEVPHADLRVFGGADDGGG